MEKYNVNDLIVGTITEIRSYGAIVTFANDYTGFLHIKQISDSYISNLKTYLKLHSEIRVRITEKNDEDKFMRLSLKDVPHEERIVFARKKEYPNVQQIADVDFSILERKLPDWIKEALEEINND